MRLPVEAGRLPGDQAADEVEHGKVVLALLLPADQDAAEAVEPGVGALDDPAAGAEAGLVFERLRLLAAGVDVGGEAELGYELVDLGIVVALVRQRFCGASGVGPGGAIGIDSIVARASLKSLRLAPSSSSPSGTPAPSQSRLSYSHMVGRAEHRANQATASATTEGPPGSKLGRMPSVDPERLPQRKMGMQTRPLLPRTHRDGSAVLENAQAMRARVPRASLGSSAAATSERGR